MVWSNLSNMFATSGHTGMCATQVALPWEPGWAAAVSDGTPQDGQLSGLDSPPGPF